MQMGSEAQTFQDQNERLDGDNGLSWITKTDEQEATGRQKEARTSNMKKIKTAKRQQDQMEF